MHLTKKQLRKALNKAWDRALERTDEVWRLVSTSRHARYQDVTKIIKELEEKPKTVFDYWDGEERAWCPDCGIEHELVRPGKTQPTCDCDTICPDCGQKTIRYHTEGEVKNSKNPNISGYFCSECGPLPGLDSE